MKNTVKLLCVIIFGIVTIFALAVYADVETNRSEKHMEDIVHNLVKPECLQEK